MDEQQPQQTPPQPTPAAPSQQEPHNQSFMKKVENWLEDVFGKKAPQLPDNWREVIVKVMPWITLILMVLALPLILVALGISAVALPITMVAGVRGGTLNIVLLLISIASLVLELIALPGLFKRQLRSWYLIYYAALLGVISAVIGLLSMSVGGIIGSAIGFYILFQIKKYYR